MSDFRRPAMYVTKRNKVVPAGVLADYALKSKVLSQQDAFSTLYGPRGLVEPLYPPYILAGLLEINTAHARCCKVKARDTAGLGWDLLATVDEPSAQSLALKDRIVQTINDMEMPLAAVLDRAMQDYEAISYGAVEVVRENLDVAGDLVQLVHLPAADLRIHRSANKYAQVIGGKCRWFKRILYDMDVDQDTGDEFEPGTLAIEKRATEVIFFTNYSPRNSYYGLPDIIPAIGAITGDTSRRQYNVSFFENYGVPSYAVLLSGNYDPGEPCNDDGTPNPNGRTPLEREIETHLAELAQNPHSVLILSLPSVAGAEGDVHVEFKPLSVETKEASFRLFRQDNREEVISAHGVPSNRLGIDKTGALAGSTAIEATKVYKSSIIKPRQEMLENLINRNIIWGMFEAPDWKFELAEIDLEDETATVSTVKELFIMGGCTPNEIIQRFGAKFGFKESDHPAMTCHYVNNKAVDYIPPADLVDMAGQTASIEQANALLSAAKEALEAK